MCIAAITHITVSDPLIALFHQQQNHPSIKGGEVN
jgi:hypothetical protein